MGWPPKLCRWADLTFPALSFSAYRSTLVIGWFTKLCPAKRSRICVNRRLELKTRLVNNEVFLVQNVKCLVSVYGRKQNTENECTRTCIHTDGLDKHISTSGSQTLNINIINCSFEVVYLANATHNFERTNILTYVQLKWKYHIPIKGNLFSFYIQIFLFEEHTQRPMWR